MSLETLTKEEWSKLIRSALKNFAQIATRERGAINQAAKAVHLSRPAIEKMKSSGTGSVESWIKLVAFYAKYPPDAMAEFLKNLPSHLGELEAPHEIDKMFVEVKRLYSKQELAAWMKLLLSKRQVEDYLGVTVSARVKKKQTRLRAAEAKPKLKK